MGLSSALGAVIGSGISSAANVYMSREQMQWQERMSNTAHQREVKDLRLAGLNPILSAGGQGATTPAGSVPTIHDLGSALTSGKAVDIQRTVAAADVGLKNATAAKEVAAANNLNADTKVKESTIPLNSAYATRADAETQFFKANTDLVKMTYELQKADRDAKVAMLGEISARIDNLLALSQKYNADAALSSSQRDVAIKMIDKLEAEIKDIEQTIDINKPGQHAATSMVEGSGDWADQFAGKIQAWRRVLFGGK